MGLQRAGKTTFLAAFWDVVGSGDVTGSLRLERTEGDMQYLNEIREAWADCHPIARTGPASDKPVGMRLIDTSSPGVTDLAWTDMLGERFERQWTERAWTVGYQHLVDDAVGILLFAHPYEIHDSPLIIDAQNRLHQLEQPVPESREVSASPEVPAPPITPEPFDARKVPTQVQLVDLLQFVVARRRIGRLRLSVVVSAWDLVEKVMKITPGEWFTNTMPLLAQFVEANDDRFDAKVFGVSAQGGSYADAATMRKAHHRASDRIKVVYDAVLSHDITAPVRWTLGSSSV
jgi:hypothetical protein